ncbi:hypothetical protein LP414_33165 [Polaromonas sp. P1(28)-13]|nr:hypothetical protein LP414_33165 [Polaromonas sp. P1(28)-13]
MVNWNGATDTIACLRSIQRLKVKDDQLSVVIVDNASADTSVCQITSELLDTGYAVSARNISREEVERVISETWFESSRHPAHDICVVSARQNLGFAAGNNIGFRIAMAVKQPCFMWHLNNDTEVAP